MNRNPIATLGFIALLLLGTAPDVKAQWSGPSSGFAEQQGASQATVLLVNSRSGSDRTGNGNERSPFKTLTHALRIAQPNTLIILAPGIYSGQTGETFPIQLKPGVTVQGNPEDRGKTVILRGGGDILSPTMARQNVTVLGTNQAGLAGVTVSNPNPRGYGLWIESTSPTIASSTFTNNTHDGIVIAGNARSLIRENYVYRNGANGISILGTARPEVRENVVERTGFGINVAQNAAPLMVGNRIVGNEDGIVVQNRAQPVLRSNLIERNIRDGLVTIAQAEPNLGTPEEAGGNQFSRNGRWDINAQSSQQTILAFGNQLASDRLRGNINWEEQSPVGRSVALTAPPAPIQSILVREIRRGSPSRPETPLTAAAFPVPSQLVPNSPDRSVPISLKTRSIPVPSPLVQNSPIRSVPLPSETQSIPIPVPPPQTVTVRQVSSTRQARPSSRQSRTLTLRPLPPAAESIPIPVPPPETAPALPAEFRDKPATGLLPVPGPNIPIGKGGKTPPPPNTRLAALRYRVLVEAQDELQTSQIRSLVPDAFNTFMKGRRVIQAGAFAERTKADELLQMLLSNGLQARIEEL
ncbi:MAG: DUF1565 domain-containing protein [Leptolyngbyaceae cyanobacterium bins.59]|nr:DUF1565 domain-containing protein [Leptolyngbyaceae cyanobacterium bins.59]